MNTEKENLEEKLGDKLEGLFTKAKGVSMSNFKKAELRHDLDLAMTEKSRLPDKANWSWMPRLLAPALVAFALVFVLVNRSSPTELNETSVSAPSVLMKASQGAPEPEAYGAVQNFYADDSATSTGSEM